MAVVAVVAVVLGSGVFWLGLAVVLGRPTATVVLGSGV